MVQLSGIQGLRSVTNIAIQTDLDGTVYCHRPGVWTGLYHCFAVPCVDNFLFSYKFKDPRSSNWTNFKNMIKHQGCRLHSYMLHCRNISHNMDVEQELTLPVFFV